MPEAKFHISDQDLLLSIDGELPTRSQSRVESHLAACWTCRVRKQELESAIAHFVRHQGNFTGEIPPPDGPRALLKARMEQMAAAGGTSWLAWCRGISWRLSAAMLATLCALGALAYLTFEMRARHAAEDAVAVFAPDPNLTPGATVLVNRGQVCSESSTNNKIVPIALQRRVFDEYRIGAPRPSAYEVDYLITPALGGADDIHNLWPQSKRATLWNAEVKDALEDRLRDLVCAGQVDLPTAQHDMAANWIAAYKKYFHTDRPLTAAR